MTAVTRGFVSAWGAEYMAVAYPTKVFRFASTCPREQDYRVAAVPCGPKVMETFRVGEWPEHYQGFRAARDASAASGITFERARARS